MAFRYQLPAGVAAASVAGYTFQGDENGMIEVPANLPAEVLAKLTDPNEVGAVMIAEIQPPAPVDPLAIPDGDKERAAWEKRVVATLLLFYAPGESTRRTTAALRTRLAAVLAAASKGEKVDVTDTTGETGGEAGGTGTDETGANDGAGVVGGDGAGVAP